jgi:hypothetical protein
LKMRREDMVIKSVEAATETGHSEAGSGSSDVIPWRATWCRVGTRVERQRNPGRLCLWQPTRIALRSIRATAAANSLQMKLAELAMLCPNPAHRAGD